MLEGFGKSVIFVWSTLHEPQMDPLGNHQALVGLTNEIALFPKHAGRKSATGPQLAQNVQQLLEQ
jgi:hypothetical protein